MMSLQDAKNRFSAVVDAALSGRPQEVSRRGKPAVVVVSVEQYRQLVTQARARRESFSEHLMRFPGGEDVPRAAAALRDVGF